MRAVVVMSKPAVGAAEPDSPAAALRELMADSPEIDRAIRRVAHARLGTR